MRKRPSLTVGFTARERFSRGAAALTQLFRNTELPFNLVVIDGNMPERYRREIEAVTSGRTNVQFIRRNHFLLPNAAKNLVIEASHDEYLLLMENDCFVHPGCIDRLVAAAEEFPADVAAPLIFEGLRWLPIVHHDHWLGRLEELPGPDGKPRIRFHALPGGNLKRRLQRERSRIELFENHCLLLRRSVFERLGPLDETLNTDEHVDLALSLHRAGMPVVFEPAARVHFESPPPVAPDEEPFFHFRWDVEKAASGNQRIRERWAIENMPEAAEFARSQHFRVRRGTWIKHHLTKSRSNAGQNAKG